MQPTIPRRTLHDPSECDFCAGELIALAQIEAGEVHTFASGAEAAAWLMSDEDD